MVRLASRLLPLAMLGLGSWIGLGGLSSTAHGRSLLGGSPRLESPGPTGPAWSRDERPVSPVDMSQLPDPNPWPVLNPGDSVSRAWLLAEGPVPSEANGRRLITLTFDDGPFPETTPVVLHVLEKHHVHATFFWIGRYLDGNSDRAARTREVALRIRDAGHLIGTHTHDHERLIGISHAESLAQIDRGMASIEQAVGVRPSVFRPPYGQIDVYAEGIARDRGLTLVLWNIETQDLKQSDPDAMARNLEEQIEFNGGGIVLLHDIRFTTAEALDRLLTWTDRHRYDPARPGNVGYDVVDFAEFTRATAASPQPFETRAELEQARAKAWRSHHPESGLPPVAAVDEAPLAF